LSRLIFGLQTLLIMSLVGGCASKMDYEKSQDTHIKAQYEQKVRVKEIPVVETPKEEPVSVVEPVLAPKEKPSITADKTKQGKSATLERHQPDVEDGEGFIGRRPVVDPFRVGEKVTLAISYFNMTAGFIDLEVAPFVEVNGKRSYSFKITARSNSFFNTFYSVDDAAQTYVDYNTLLPVNFTIMVKESKQVADIRSFFDFKKLKGNYWSKRVHKDKGERIKELEWNIKPFSQNVISAIYYLRTFQLSPGKKLGFRVADEGKNIMFTGDVLRREEISTDLGKLKTIVVKPTIEVEGVFKPVGDIFLWLTDDDRKLLVRLESKIKIGTLVGKIKAIQPGH
jgi:hypothetical protein